MPYVNIKLAGEVTREQKAEIAKEITETLERVANKPKSYTYITFEEVAYEDWAIGGELLGQFVKKLQLDDFLHVINKYYQVYFCSAKMADIFLIFTF